MNNLEIRPLSFDLNPNRYAEGSVLIKMGYTHVLCTASIENSVPVWLKDKKSGWITSEYAMLPRATHTRSKRDREKISGRTQEIQRLIGRSLRAMIDLSLLGERSVLIDCDVLQADGGTRTASVNGGAVALSIALKKLIKDGVCPPSTLKDLVSAVSVGLKAGKCMADLNYEQDSTCDVDMNFVGTSAGNFIEIQGTAEKGSFSEADLDLMKSAAKSALKIIAEKQRSCF